MSGNSPPGNNSRLVLCQTVEPTSAFLHVYCVYIARAVAYLGSDTCPGNFPSGNNCQFGVCQIVESSSQFYILVLVLQSTLHVQ